MRDNFSIVVMSCEFYRRCLWDRRTDNIRMASFRVKGKKYDYWFRL